MTGQPTAGPYGLRPTIEDLAGRVRRRLADEPDLNRAVTADPDGLHAAVAAALHAEGLLLPPPSFAAAVRAVTDELTGLGPLAPLLTDPTVTDVCVNGPGEVWVERDGRLERTSVRFASRAELGALIQRVVAPLGLRVDEARPWVDARLPGGERFHAVLPPLAPDGPVVTIRAFARRRLRLPDLVARGSLDLATGQLLHAMVAAGVATVISGATGCGKTTLLNVLATAIPGHERVVTIEDAAELDTRSPHVVRLEARPPNVEGRGEVPLRELVRNALRMRPDRIVVGECRGGEVLDMLQAANTGHRGLLTTIHAGSPEEVPGRLEAMALSAPGAVLEVVRRLIGAVQAIIHLERAAHGRRVAAVAALHIDPEGRAVAVPVRVRVGGDGLAATGHVPGWARLLDRSVLRHLEPPPMAGAGVRALPVRGVSS